MHHPLTRSRYSWVLIVLLASLVACSSSGRDDIQGYSVETIDGIRVQVFAETHQAPINPFSLVQSITFGTEQGADTYLLSRPFPMGLGPDGNLYVMDLMEAIHRFAPDGTHRGQFYRKGQGPGEFSMLQDLVVDKEHLYSADLILGRMNVFAHEGTWLRSIPFPAETRQSPYWSVWGPRSERKYLIWRQGNAPGGAEGTANFSITLLDNTLHVIDIPVDISLSYGYYSIGDQWQFLPFTNTIPQVALAPDLPVAWSDGSEFRIDFFSAQTGARWATIIPHDPLPVTEAMKKQFFESYRRPDQLEELRRNIRFPDHASHIQSAGMRWDMAGRLWVCEYRDRTASDAPYRYHVFSRNGIWLFSQDLPTPARLITELGVYC
ncbi:hypothetical protein ACFL6T_07185, partial [Candidatus Zixiibacteriota bacterium]